MLEAVFIAGLSTAGEISVRVIPGFNHAFIIAFVLSLAALVLAMSMRNKAKGTKQSWPKTHREDVVS